jgi:hypothetical protein
LDGWLGELGRKNLLLLAASPAKPAELGEFGDWKLKIENWKKVLSFQAGNNYQKIFLFLFLFYFYFYFFSRPCGRGFYRISGR